MARLTSGPARPVIGSRIHVVGLVLLALLGALVPLMAWAPPAHGAAPQSISVSFQPSGTSCTEVLAKGPDLVTSVPADGTRAISLCIHIEDVATGTDQGGLPIELRVTVGTVGSSGTSRYSGILFTSSAGVAQISYRGDGKSFGTDTAIVRYEAGNAIATTSIEVLPATGVTATLVMVDPHEQTIAASSTRVADRFVSPTTGAAIPLQVQDWRGLGVNNQVLLARTDRGRLAANPGLLGAVRDLCVLASAPALALISAPTNILPSQGRAMPGTINFLVCADADAEPGPVRVTVESVSGLLAPITIELRQAGRPASVTTTVAVGVVTAAVTDAGGHLVADGVPIRFVISPAAGSVSSGCVLSRHGLGSTAVGLMGVKGAVLVVADYHVTGTAAATCATLGTEQITTAVRVGPTAPVSDVNATRAATDGDAGVEVRTSDRSDP